MNLFIFQNILDDKIIASLCRFRETGEEAAYFKASRGLIRYSSRRLTQGSIIKEYILRAMLEADDLPEIPALRDYLRHDIKILYHELLTFDWDGSFRAKNLLPLENMSVDMISTGLESYAASIASLMNCASSEALSGAVLAHVESFGTGPTTAYSALKWKENWLAGIERPDVIRFEDLTGLAHQKKVLIANTEAFVSGRTANDVLLTGSSGTGKSSCVKACLQMFKDRGLRLIELNKADLDDLPGVFAGIKNHVLKYIVFIDDLSFEPGDVSYKLLKSALDGQAESRGDNVLIYATSNRRSLIKETWAEREGYLSDEVHRSEGMNEKKSLAARFGINLSFITPTQAEYLEIVKDLLGQKGIEMTEEMQRQALTWEINYNGFSGRTAKQFVAHVLVECVL